MALRESEANLEAILESTADGILAVDDSRRILAANRRFAELWRVPDSVLESNDDEALLAYVLDQVDEPDGFFERVRALYPSVDTAVDILCLKDGRVFERHSAAIMGSSGVSGRVWSFSDVTDKVLARTELQERERTLSTLLGNLPGMAYRCENDRHWTMRFVSAGCEDLTGYPPEALLDNAELSYADLIWQDDSVADEIWESVCGRSRSPVSTASRLPLAARSGCRSAASRCLAPVARSCSRASSWT